MKNYYDSFIGIQSDIYRENILIKSFYEDNQPFYGFKKISQERKEVIEKLALMWNLSHKNCCSKRTLFYQILNEIHAKRNHALKDFYIDYGDESFLFFILTFDPNLEILKLCMEEANKIEIKRRFKENFGFNYDDRLRQIEFYYNKKYPTLIDEPQKKHS